jgi:hypothetical protein
VIAHIVESSARGQLHQLRDSRQIAVGCLVLLVAAVVLWLRRSPAGPRVLVTLGAAVVLWWVFDKAVEGPTVLHVTRRHGVTLADLVPVVLIGAATVRRHDGSQGPAPGSVRR